MKNILNINISKNFCTIEFIKNKNKYLSIKYFNKNHLKNIFYIINNIIENNKKEKINLVSYIKYPGNTINSKISSSISKGLSISLNIPMIKIDYFEYISEIINKKFFLNKNILIITKYFSNIIYFSICKKNKKGIWKIKTNKYENIEYIINYINSKKNKFIINFNNIDINIKNLKNNKLIFTNFSKYKIDIIYKILKNKIKNYL